MIEEKTMGITTTLKKTYPRKGREGRGGGRGRPPIRVEEAPRPPGLAERGGRAGPQRVA